MPNLMFPGASIGTISGGIFVNHSEKSALDRISEATAHSALHDAPARTDDSRCHQYTRKNVLQKLECWAQGVFEEGASVFWLYGGAGAGKSAVMQTLAERCAAQGLTLGSFFFSRGDPTRNTAEVVIPTLVYQLVQFSSFSMDVLGPIIDHDPLIFKRSFKVQLLNLFVLPLQHLVHLGIISGASQTPRVFLIDGLDECGDPVQQQAIIHAMAAVCHEHGIPVKFLIASRPEHAISASFRWHSQSGHILASISLSEDTDAEADIRQFIEDEFLKIRTAHPFNHMIPSIWPKLYDINRLVWKSSSHFIYASTAMKYIWSEKESPVRSLQVVLGLEVSRTISPFSELDALYHHIIGSAAHPDKVLQILAHCVCKCLPLSKSVVCIMLDCSHDDLSIYMADITPLVALSQPAFPWPRPGKEDEVTFLHASLEDFLRDQSRSRSLYIDQAVYLASKLERCFQVANLYSHQQRTEPDWPIGSADSVLDEPYYRLHGHIMTTVKTSGHLVATQEVLRRYSLRDFHERQLRFQKFYQEMPYIIYHVIGFFITIQAIVSISRMFFNPRILFKHSDILIQKTSDGLMLFPNYLEDFFDILESHISLESAPLGPAILPLIFSAYPAQDVCQIHYYHSCGTSSYKLIAERFMNGNVGMVTTLDVITTADLASIRHSINNSPENLSVAAEAILGYLFAHSKLRWLSSYSAHMSWLRRTKPGKHVSITGVYRLASAFHARRLRSSRTDIHLPDEPVFVPSSLPSWKQKCSMVSKLLEALLWVLPKASFSEKIALYSARPLPRNIYQCEPGLCHRVRKCLNKYSARARGAKLEDLTQRIEHGDVRALIEKLCILDLDALD